MVWKCFEFIWHSGADLVWHTQGMRMSYLDPKIHLLHFVFYIYISAVQKWVFSPHHDNNIMFLNRRQAALLDAVCVCATGTTHNIKAKAAALSPQPPAVLYPP